MPPSENTSSPLVIDSHHHLWPARAVPTQSWQPPGQDILHRAYEPADLTADLARAGVTGTVVMQSVDAPEENDRLLSYAAEPFVRGIVAWAPLEDPARCRDLVSDLRARADRSAAAPVVGLRRLIGTEPIDWASDRTALAAFDEFAAAGLAWDVVPVTAAQRETVVRVARAVPQLRIVVDHLGSPPLTDGETDSWYRGLDALAACPNVAVKLSVGVAVLARAEHWPVEAVGSWVRAVLERFGPDRCMAASNWPVVLLQTDYATAWDAVAAAAREVVPAAALTDVLGGTATRWYALPGAGDE